jgi:predicted ferric reductase
MSEKNKYTLLMALIGVTIAPIPFIVVHSNATFTSWSSVALYISGVLGYLGIVLLLWMYVLGTKSVIGLYFQDLVAVRKLHAKLGKYGVVLVFAHPIGAAFAYGQNLLTYTLLPDISSEFEVYVTFGRVALYVLLIVWITSAIARSKIAYRPWKYIHYIAYLALPLALLHVPSTGSSFAVERPAQFYYLVAVGIFTLFSILRIRQLFEIGKSSYIITSQVNATADVMLLRLSPNGGRVIGGNKGQFVYLQMRLLGEEHPFSVLQYNDQTGDMTVAYKTFGPFTKKLAAQAVGSRVYVDGPYGTFTQQMIESHTMPTVFIAGGIGITPFVDHIMSDNAAETWLFYANQSTDTTAFGKALSAKLGERYVPILSNEDIPRVEHGYMRSDILSKYLSRPTDYQYFICGPPKMMDITKQSLIGLGVGADNIHSEEFSF